MLTTEDLSLSLDRLAKIDSGPFPVISLYLNLQPNPQGRDHFEPFLRKELSERLGTYLPGPERESLDRDASKIRDYVSTIDSSANGLALFACSAADLFEPILLVPPIDDHRLTISGQPHLYPLARLADEHPRYAVLLADTARSRIVVVAGDAVHRAEAIEGTKTKRHKMGGWSQARYQRHVENYHLHHAKEVVDTLARIVREEQIASIIVAGDDAIVPLLKEQFSKDIAERVVDVLKLDAHAPEHEVLRASLAAMRDRDRETDRERVEGLLDAYRAGGLAVVGLEKTRRSLDMGQVDEVLLTANPGVIDAGAAAPADQRKTERTPQERVGDEVVIKARQTGAKIRFIEEAELLATIGGIGAFLRFKA